MASFAAISAPGPRSPSGVAAITVLSTGSIRSATRSRCGTTQTESPATATAPASQPRSIVAAIVLPTGAAVGFRGGWQPARLVCPGSLLAIDAGTDVDPGVGEPAQAAASSATDMARSTRNVDINVPPRLWDREL